jgi:CBS domain-containing protein
MNAADVMVREVITVHADSSVKAIAEILLENRISAVPVVDVRGAAIGIVSEGDLIHRVETGTERHRSWWLEFLTGKETLAREFVKSHARKATDVMTQPVISVSLQTPLGDIAALMEKHRIKRVPVIDGGKLVGIVSRANLVQALARQSGAASGGDGVKDAMLRDGLLDVLRTKSWWTNKVNIVVRDGKVELWGVVDSEAEKSAIRVAVEVTPGVRAVEDNLTVTNVPTAL